MPPSSSMLVGDLIVDCQFARAATSENSILVTTPQVNKQHAYEIAAAALEDRRSTPVDDLLKLVGATEKSTLSGPDGQTYFLEIGVEKLPKESGVRVTATVDLGSSYKLERIEESIDILGN